MPRNNNILIKMYNPYSLENKKILVTGASSGIGKATAIECAKLGASVVVTARNEERLSSVFAELDRSLGQEHQMVIADLATDEGLAFLLSQVDKLNGVSSNAGILKSQVPIKFIKDDEMQDLVNTNLFSHVRLARDLYKKKKLEKGASYVFTASTGGVTTHVIGNSVYDISKSAVNSFAKSCAVDFASRNIRCNSVCPSMIETPMTAPDGVLTQENYNKDIEAHYLLGRYGKPREVALTTAFLLSDASSFITGASIMIDGGVSVNH